MGAAERSILDNRLYICLQRTTNAVLLSIVWVAATLLVVTAAPATAAMFGVVRDWRHGKEPPLLRAFGRHFVGNVRQALIVQLIWMLAGVGIVADLQIDEMLPEPIGVGLRTAAVVVALLIVATSVYVFPLMVGYDLPTGQLLRLAVLFALGRPLTTLCCLVVVATAFVLTYLVPIMPLLLSGLVASTIYARCDRVISAVRAETVSRTSSEEMCR
jgi:uncharacterized membrane protein YesL